MTGHSRHSQGFLTRLLRNEAGNTLAIVAASIIPLLGLVGGGVDMSRAYLSKSRLQQACDAGALAGRRAMADGNWDTEAQNTAKNFFDTNFETGSYGTTNLVRNFTENDNTVTGTATVTVPTSIMKMFGNASIPIAVTCVAEMKLPNTDVMFVLDTTGSMATTNSGDSVSRIEALRSAVEDFYETLEAAKGDNTRIRYGFVPYSVNVNVGHLLQRDWMVDDADYQTRVADWTGQYSTITGTWTKVSGSYTTSSNSKASTCLTNDTVSYTDNVSTTTSTGIDNAVTTTIVTTRTTNGKDYTCNYNNSGKLTLVTDIYSNYVTQKTDKNVPKYTWIYKQDNYHVSGLKGNNEDGTMTGGSITANVEDMINFQPQPLTITWNGCIEERGTVQTTNYTAIPTSNLLYDLNIDLVPDPDDDATRWKPALPGLVFGRSVTSGGSGSWGSPSSTVTTDANYMSPSGPCPTEARRLAEIDSLSTLTTYLDSLNPTGNTYHDIGILWGARLLSPDGLFAADNTSAPNGGSITRHLIFMTDGATEPSTSVYTPYGIEPIDRRRTSASSAPTTTNLTNVVNTRLAYLCTAVKNKNITIWVVAFGTTLTSNLSSCASSGKAYQANNSTELNDAFKEIAAQISQLRLTE